MKKIFLLFVSLAVLSSCSSDDDTGGDDPILGVWFLAEANNAQGLEVDECNDDSYIDFKADGTAETEFFSDESGDCIGEKNTSEWSASGDSRYTFNVPGVGNLSGRVEFSGNGSFTFYPDLGATQGTNLVFEKR
ncbi:lipocalin family protein [Salegentibacter chungangensis]|uniref:Type IV secretion system putative lipoprotein virB7 n=1 Tax=Salegentibacter chungangensis TaxID=1335724 RepID=A0ABW3NSH0_9FLAO